MAVQDEYIIKVRTDGTKQAQTSLKKVGSEGDKLLNKLVIFESLFEMLNELILQNSLILLISLIITLIFLFPIY